MLIFFQSYLARKSLNIQLQRVGAISITECIELFEEDFEILKICMESLHILLLSLIIYQSFLAFQFFL